MMCIAAVLAEKAKLLRYQEKLEAGVEYAEEVDRQMDSISQIDVSRGLCLFVPIPTT